MLPEKTSFQPELWQTTYQWLSILKNNLDQRYCKQEITTHSDYPNLISVTDFLDQGKMNYEAVEANMSYINEFNYPLLAHIRQPANEHLQIVRSVKDWDKSGHLKNYWSGIVIYPDKNTSWKNKENDAYVKKANADKFSVALLVTFGIALLSLAVCHHFNFLSAVFGVLSLIGLIIALFISGTALGYQNGFVRQLCGAVSQDGCKTVIESSFAKGLFGITPADAAVIYFTTQFILYLLSVLYPVLNNALLVIAMLCICAASWSVYIQSVKIKQWCALCLVIVVVILLQAVVAFIACHWSAFKDWSLAYGATAFLAIAVVLSTLFVSLKKLIVAVRNDQQNVAELKKWKADFDLFLAQLKQQQQIETTIWDDDLILGEMGSPLIITVACNPYCGPCAAAHKKLDFLLERFRGMIKVQMRLICAPENVSDIRTVAVKAILQNQAVAKIDSYTQQMLSDWFKWIDFQRWHAKWASPDVNVQDKLVAHARWMTDNDIKYTPTIFINGYKIPGRYTLDDLDPLIPALAKRFEYHAINNSGVGAVHGIDSCG